MADQEYRDAYFAAPHLIEPALPDFLRWLVDDVRAQLSEKEGGERTVVGLLGAGRLVGL